MPNRMPLAVMIERDRRILILFMLISTALLNGRLICFCTFIFGVTDVSGGWATLILLISETLFFVYFLIESDKIAFVQHLQKHGDGYFRLAPVHLELPAGLRDNRLDRIMPVAHI